MDSTDENDNDDARRTEFETLKAIFPELRRIENTESLYLFELEIPVELAEPLTVTFPPPRNATVGVVAAETSGNGGDAGGAAAVTTAAQPLDSIDVSHLPLISLLISLPDGYPESLPPQVKLNTTPEWLSRETLSRLEDDGPRLWEDMGRDMVAYTYIDHIQRGAEDVFGTLNADGTLSVDPDHKLAVLDYDIKAKKAAFERETFDCGICLDPKKGTSCHKMIDCGHIFCVKCLCDFYAEAIKSGELLTVRCLTPSCAKERAAKIPKDATGRSTKKAKVFISPSELLQIGLPEETVKRYVTLKYKTELESDKNTIYCPRQWCNGAARSKKHKKPQGLDLIDMPDEDDDDNDDDDDDGSSNRKKKEASKTKFNAADLLSVCDDCGFAFCSRCQQSWHGEFVRCTGKRSLEELTEEEKASLAYLELHTSPCPTCSAPAQKTHGCNHMVCSRCDSHFCYLCSAWLDPTNPYKHYNMQSDGKVTSCYMRLWELEGGDGNDIGLGFEGGQGPPAAQVRPQPEDEVFALPAELDGEEDEDSEGEESVLGDNGAHGNNPPGDEVAHIEPRPAVAREAPLVLRVMDDPAARAARNEAQNAAAAAAQRDGRLGRGRGGRGGRGDGNNRGNRGNRGGARGGAAAAGPVRAAAARGRGRAAPGHGQRLHNQHAEGQARHQQAVQFQPRQRMEQVEELDLEHGLLNAAQQAWVRRFVEMALEDMEEDGDSDDDDDNFVMR